MSHAPKTAAVVPTDSVKLFLVLKKFEKINKKSEIVKKKTFFYSCHRDSDKNAVILGLNIITCAP